MITVNGYKSGANKLLFLEISKYHYHFHNNSIIYHMTITIKKKRAHKESASFFRLVIH